RASLITSAARSSGRTVRRRPFGALPTGVRTADTMKASFMLSVPQWFAGLERVLDALDGLRLATQAQKNFAFQIKDVLLGDEVKRAQVAAAQDVRQLCADLPVVLADLAGHAHLVEDQFELRHATLAQRGNIGALRTRAVPFGHTVEDVLFGFADQPVAVQHERGLAYAEVFKFRGFVGARRNLRQANRFPGGPQGGE